MLKHTTSETAQENPLTETLPGVYTIRHKKSKTCYIGSTSYRISSRWSQHRSLLRKQKHANAHLQNAWNKYGKQAFVFEVLENTAPENVTEAEQFWIDIFRMRQVRLYNVAPAAGSQRGYRHTEETRQRLSRAHKGQKRSAEARRNMSRARKGRPNPKVAEARSQDWPPLVSPDGKVHRIRNLTNFCRQNDLDVSCLRKVAIGEKRAYKGWRLLKPGQKPRPYRGKIREYNANHTITAPDGTVYENVTNLEAFCKEHNLSPSYMRSVAVGEAIQHKGWRAIREGYEPKTTSSQKRREWPDFLSPTGEKYSCDNLYQFCRTHSLDKGAMQRLVKRQVKSHKGWTLSQ